MYSRPLLILPCLLFIASLATAVAQKPEPAPSGTAVTPRPGKAVPLNAPRVLTGKERLAEKWTDEQRTDNCKVPLDKRGPRPRPDTCPNGLAGWSSKPADLSEFRKQ
jgi:hypothetical protein